jgi:PAS domain S-box-containing protein
MRIEGSGGAEGSASSSGEARSFLAGGGELGALVAAHDWESTSLGPIEAWPQSLKTSVGLILRSPVPIVLLWGEEGVMIYNDAYAVFAGGRHPQLLGSRVREGWPEVADFNDHVMKVGLGGGTLSYKDQELTLHRHGAPEQVWMDLDYSPVLDESGGPAGVIAIVVETTERVRVTRDLRESEAKFHAMANSIDQMIWATRPDGFHDYYNQRWYEYTGVPEGSTDGEAWNDMFHPEDQERAWKAWRHCLETGEPYHIEYRLRHRSGGYRWVLGRAQPVRDASGQIARWYGTCTDVDDLKVTEEALRDSEERFRQVFRNAAVGMIEIDADWNILNSNEVYREITGRSEADLRGANCLSFTHPDDVAAGEEALRALAAGEENRVAFEKRYLRPNGEVVWVRSSLSRVSGHQSAALFLKVVEDITEIRKAREALREESEALEVLNRTAAKVAAELDLDQLVQTVTDAGVELTGAQFGAFFYNVIDEQGEHYTLYSLAGVDPSHFDKFPMPRNTHIFGPTFRGEGVVRSADITKDPRYGKMAPYHGMPEGHLPVRSYLAVSVVSRSGEVIGGLFFGHEQVGVFSERSERLMSGLAAQAAIGIDNARLFQAAQRLNQTLEAQVEERTAERDRLWALSEDLLVTADYEGKLLRVSPSWSRLLGYDEATLLDRSYASLIHAEDLAAVLEALATMRATQQPVSFEDRLEDSEGQLHWISWRLSPDPDGLRLHGVGRDITDAKARAQALAEAEERLRQAQKMETLGQLTGGVAHDFNNLLQIVSGNLEILQRNLDPEQARLRRAAENASRGAERAASLTQRLLAFSRRQPLDPKPIDANKLVAGMSELLHRTLGETIEVETVLASGLWRIEADPNQLENAILNLALNARDAMQGGGKLTIETSNAHLDRGYTAANAEVVPGQYVVICVSDTGTGMDEETAARAFEPFFTTKEVGKGTGLGLSMVYGFVKQSGGHLKIYSEPGHGTTLKIYLPRLLGSLPDEAETREEIVPEGTREETILVCEDDDDVRAYSVEVLRELGYRVLEAHDGPSALRLLERQEGRVDLLFTDVVLPSGMTGAVLAERARELRPELKVLFTTGYARNAIVHHGRLDAGVELITKPFTYADLAARVRDLLDGAR